MLSRNNKAEELVDVRMGMVHRSDIEKRNDGHEWGGLINYKVSWQFEDDPGW